MATTTTPDLSPSEPTGRDDQRDADRRRQLAVLGGRDILPVLLGVLPLAMVIGIAVRDAGVDRAPAWTASFLLCAGAAQLTAIELLGSGTAPLAIVLTTTLINSRFVLYSAGLARWFSSEPLWRRLLLALPLVDQLFVVCQRRFASHADSPDDRRWYYLGAAVTLVTGWSGGQAVAIVFAPALPGMGVLHLASPLVFIGLLTASLKNRAGLVAAVAGGASVVAAAGLPFHLNLAVGIGAGLAAGLVVTKRSAT
jgi:predicted branched-subunit amino acid permease